MDNANSSDYLQKIKIQVIENLRQTVHAPSVQQTDVPRDPEGFNDEAEAELDDIDEDENGDTRFTKRRWDKYIEKDGELSESEDEDVNAENGVTKQRTGKRRRNIMDYQNPLAGPSAEDALASGAMSARSGRSRANGVDGGSELSENENADDESNLPGDGDEDVEMIDGPSATAAQNGPNATRGANGTTEGIATPPDSPEQVAQDVTVPGDVAEQVGNEAMDEGDVDVDVGDEKEVGREIREMEDIDAEKVTEEVERKEEAR